MKRIRRCGLLFIRRKRKASSPIHLSFDPLTHFAHAGQVHLPRLSSLRTHFSFKSWQWTRQWESPTGGTCNKEQVPAKTLVPHKFGCIFQTSYCKFMKNWLECSSLQCHWLVKIAHSPFNILTRILIFFSWKRAKEKEIQRKLIPNSFNYH